MKRRRESGGERQRERQADRQIGGRDTKRMRETHREEKKHYTEVLATRHWLVA
jgi:hypothetical protein